MRLTENTIEKNERLILWGILALGLLLRLYHIDKQSLWLDELYSVVPTNPENSLSSILEYCKEDQPPLFFIYIHYVFKIFGYSSLVGRVASAVIGFAGVAAVYFLGRESANKSVGLFASFLAAINYFHIYYSQELRFYSMAFLFTTLSCLFFIRAVKRARIADYLLYSLFTACLLYTHYYGLFIFAGQALTFLVFLFHKRELRFAILSFASGVVTVVLFMPWIPIIFRDLRSDLGWIKSPEPYFVAQYFYDYTGKEVVTTICFLGFIYLFCVLLSSKNTSRETKLICTSLTIWIVVSYLVPYLRSIFVSPMLNNRYTIITLPAWFVVLAIGWNQVQNLKWKYALPAVLFIAFLVNMAFFKKHYSGIHKSQFREASEIVLSNNPLHYPVYSNVAWHFNFYFRESPYKAADFSTMTHPDKQKFWLLIGHYPEPEMAAEIAKLQQNFVIIEQHSLFEASAVLLVAK